MDAYLPVVVDDPAIAEHPGLESPGSTTEAGSSTSAVMGEAEGTKRALPHPRFWGLCHPGPNRAGRLNSATACPGRRLAIEATVSV
jgi:hypothetical protein